MAHHRGSNSSQKEFCQPRSPVRADENQIRLRFLGSVQNHASGVALQHQGSRIYASAAKFIYGPIYQIRRVLPGLFGSLRYRPQMGMLQHIQYFDAGFRGQGRAAISLITASLASEWSIATSIFIGSPIVTQARKQPIIPAWFVTARRC